MYEVNLSGGALVAVVIVGLAALALDIACIVDIVRRPAVLGGHKWVWILVVLVFNLLGPLMYLAIGRTQPPAVEPPAQSQEAATGEKAATAADLLYGPAAPAATGSEGPQGEAPPSGDPPAAPDVPEPPPAPPAAS